MNTAVCNHCGTKITNDSESECQLCRRPLDKSKLHSIHVSSNRDLRAKAFEENPFQAPQSDLEQLDDLVPLEMWVDGNCLVVNPGAELPLFCVKTNVPIEPRFMKTKTLTWCTPYLALLILVSPIIYIIAYFIVRKNCRVSFGVSPEYSRRMRKWLLAKIGFLIFSFFHLIAAIVSDSIVWITVAIALFMVSIIAPFLGNAVLRAKSHKEGQFWISGCSKEFLSRFDKVG